MGSLARTVWLLLVLCCVPALAIPPADPAGLTRFTLDNGLRVWLHPAPPGNAGPEAGVMLVIRSGAIDEADDEIGAAYLAKRAAGLGTPGASGERLERLRTRFGRPGSSLPASKGGHARLTHESVMYALVFEPDDDRAWSDALAHYADLLGGWSPPPAVIDQARAMAAERLGAMSPEEQARHRFIPDLFPEHAMGRRALIPAPEVGARTGPDAVARHLERRYRPELTTLIVVGDFDTDRVLARVRERLAGVSRDPAVDAGEREPLPPAGVGGRASFHAVPGYAPGEVSLLSIGPRGSDEGSDPQRAGVFDAVAAELIAGRVRPAAALGDAGVVSVETVVKGWINGSRIAEISVRAEPDGLAGAGRAVAMELSRIARDGFRPEELRAARAAVLAAAERQARAWSEAAAPTVAERLIHAARGDPDAWIPPTEASRHAARVLASTTDRALDAHARRVLDPGTLACVMLAKREDEDLDHATAERILRVAAAPAGPRARTVPDQLAPPGEPGSVLEITHDPAIDVWTGRLQNGVVVRAKRMPNAERAVVRVGIAEGPSREDAATAGRTVAALHAWCYPSIGGLDAGQVRAWSMTRGLTHRVLPGEDMVILEVEAADASGLGDALTLAAAMLARPGADPAYAERSRRDKPDFGPAIRRLGERMVTPGDPRVTNPLEVHRDPRVLSAWLGVLAASPLEVSLVGDFSAASAIESAARTLGALPDRAPPSAHRGVRWGPLPADESPDRIPADATPEALLGLVFGDAADVDAVRPMIVAAAAVRAELERMRDAGRLDAKPAAWIWLGDGLPGRATLVVRCEHAADPARAMDAIEQALRRVADGRSDAGVIEAELARTGRLVDRAWEQTAFWSDRLAKLSAHGQDTGVLSGMRASYESLTVRDVRDALAAALASGVRKPVLVVPE
ncbi:MAG: hypothetical protein LAT64_14495 [Phycisphaerales bacterium]|nr:insulinase family protein [Planctomycetota bacterium]MCH8509958.1 hypothetical protein [Phycisphaerales bacterium]